jgi:hypothetical protein
MTFCMKEMKQLAALLFISIFLGCGDSGREHTPVVTDRLNLPPVTTDEANGNILAAVRRHQQDSFPSFLEVVLGPSPVQRPSLDEMLARADDRVCAALYVEVATEDLVARLTGRRV